MRYPLHRAREIISKRGELSPWATEDQRRTVEEYLRRWEQHCLDVVNAPYFTHGYVRIYNRFLAYQQSLLDNPNAPLLGKSIQDRMYLSALETRLRGRFVPVTYQSPTFLKKEWYDVCYDYLCADLISRGDEGSFEQITSVLNDVFNYADASIFPRVYVDAFAALMDNMSAYNERVHQTNEPPFHKSFRILIRALHASVYG